MGQIFFIRHAKSSWEDMRLADEKRPLNKRGLRDAPLMAAKLKGILSEVDLIIGSPAVRAQQTLTFFKEAIPAKSIITQDEVYHAPLSTLLEVLKGIDPEAESALIFGHNPGFTSMFNHFSINFLDNLPTCGIFRLHADVSWSKMTPDNTKCDCLMYPKMYL